MKNKGIRNALSFFIFFALFYSGMQIWNWAWFTFLRAVNLSIENRFFLKVEVLVLLYLALIVTLAVFFVSLLKKINILSGKAFIFDYPLLNSVLALVSGFLFSWIYYYFVQIVSILFLK